MYMHTDKKYSVIALVITFIIGLVLGVLAGHFGPRRAGMYGPRGNGMYQRGGMQGGNLQGPPDGMMEPGQTGAQQTPSVPATTAGATVQTPAATAGN